MTGPWLRALAALLAVALPAAARSTSQIADRIDADLEAWDIEGAQRGLDDLLAQDPGSVASAYFRTRVLFEQGKYGEAEGLLFALRSPTRR